MKTISLFVKSIVIVGVLVSVFSCEKMMMDTKSDPTAKEVLESMWKIVDEKYSYIEYKNINWDSVRTASLAKLTPNTSSRELFKIMSETLYELRDGHVNLFSSFDVSRNWDWYLDSPQNFNYSVVERNYLKSDYWISGGLKNAALDYGKYGYVYYGSFSSSVNSFGMILNRFSAVKGLIIDLRDNGGGYLDNAHILADYLADQKRLTYTMVYKDGPRHDNFSKAYPHYSQPSQKPYTKQVVILTNRSCYSATSFFVAMAKEFPNVTVIGDYTGGGAGLPIDFILPNGWQIRLSSSRTFDAQGKDFELGVAPDIRHDLNPEALRNGVDSMIELAKQIIDQKTL